jgi:[FeFe] hydrogenase H-cluster maturation GTPase HydF
MTMQTTPKSLRMQIGLFGRMNVGKSSFLNMVAGQDVAITSPVPGTTTDVVEKSMELLPLGPVVFLDTAGLDDTSALGAARTGRTERVFERADVAVLLTESGRWGEHETHVTEMAHARKMPLVIVVNKADLGAPDAAFRARLAGLTPHVVVCAATDAVARERQVSAFKQVLVDAAPEGCLAPPALVGDLLPAGGVAVLVVPIDLQAPQGRLILPQVQTIRDALDNDAAALVVKERELAHILTLLSGPPSLVVCDSQVIQKVVADVPPAIPCTTFSILMARHKGDLATEAAGVAAVDRLRPGDRVLVAEACSHHPLQDDIGRVKIPRWLRQYAGADLVIETCAGRDFPDDLDRYRLVIHCGACMLTRREMLRRIERAREAGVGITNFGLCIAHVQGVLERALGPFPAALEAYLRARELTERAPR